MLVVTESHWLIAITMSLPLLLHTIRYNALISCRETLQANTVVRFKYQEQIIGCGKYDWRERCATKSGKHT